MLLRFRKIHRKIPLSESFLIKLPLVCNFIKPVILLIKRLRSRCFSENFSKFLRIQCEGLFLLSSYVVVDYDFEKFSLSILNFYLCSFNGCSLIQLKPDSQLPKKKNYLLQWQSPLKMMKNAFYFILKALFVLKIFKFFSWLFGHAEKMASPER